MVMKLPFTRRLGRNVALALTLGGVAVAGYYVWKSYANPEPQGASPRLLTDKAAKHEQNSEAVGPTMVHCADLASAGVVVAAPRLEKFPEALRLTGKVSLNEDRIAHIFPVVEGTVEKVSVTLGQVVKSNDLLVMIHSREVGRAKLELYQARLQHELALVKDKLQTEIADNTQLLLKALRNAMPILEIEQRFRDRRMGDYREKLLQAYSSFLKSDADLDRLNSVTDSGAISTKQVAWVQAGRNADQATFQSRIEQVDHELKMLTLLSSQTVKEAFTRVAVSEANLRILGCDEADIQSVDPIKQGEAISDYAVRAPFDGTIIAKDVVLREQARMDRQIIGIADLSTVWIDADIYEQNIPLLASLAGQKISVSNEAWPSRKFEAKVFFTGEVMDEKTRTVAMRAMADNPEHLLKPGMFVAIEIIAESAEPKLQVPIKAVQEHQGAHFVFVQKAATEFERRNVTVGKSNDTSVVIESGLSAQEQIAVDGGFILKSIMLADLMGEE